MSTPTAPTGLRDRLRTGTHDLHTQAERSPAMRALIRGEMGQGAYVALLRNLHTLYAALEPALEAGREHAFLAPIHQAQLSRLPALESDLDALHGPGWKSVDPARTAREYADRLRTLSKTDPGLLAAHAYVRYLGDLSGGQLLLERVRKMLKLEGDAGTRFYVFGEPGAKALAAQFRAGLAALPATEADIERLVDEAKLAFELHTRLFEELAPAA